MSAPAGWYPDPEHPGLQRRWNGGTWTDERQPAPPAPQMPTRRRGPGCLGALLIFLTGVVVVVFVLIALVSASRPASDEGAPGRSGLSGGVGLTSAESDYVSAARVAAAARGFAPSDMADADILQSGRIACDYFARHSDVDRSLAITALLAGSANTIPESLHPLANDLVSLASARLCPE
ncbi:MAG: DUF2510 domain-containing protein [Microbacterium sp.]|nr:DUF2510 domain-containing protein [Microbacterium sp.]MBQ9917801.1 DUF2510 domain-containing protein [Microbacterium sp.]